MKILPCRNFVADGKNHIVGALGSDFDCTWNFEEAPTTVYRTEAELMGNPSINRVFSTEKVRYNFLSLILK